ncbi:polyprenyl synthetase family protein [Amygdalobacter indicium]|uniref:Polyprenyl synthetase family protein n=1 Tax=Amygdalobacter indicium TaxID=3029272 RepID=A0ABY8C805_9FIRM|nr:polyprenyl synthetase family protein [Amygdalobacter indicium]WEG33996.1 polyprenyl synthetase family protein [Amygdalobacter indicium]WEG35567.1 polyprenyl synthetase family protein [Amygdalobacter indicium]
MSEMITTLQNSIEQVLAQQLNSYSLTSYLQISSAAASLNTAAVQASRAVYAEFTAAMKYSTLDGGKRIRPLLCLLWSLFWLEGQTGETLPLFCPNRSDDSAKLQTDKAELYNKWQLAWNFAAALELIHCYSLVHDDLPAMDNAAYRRGKLSVQKKFGEATAVLVGDALLTMALRSAGAGEADLSPALYRRVERARLRLGDSAGANGMVGGQVLDLGVPLQQDSLADYLTCIAGKTAALLQASIVIPAILFAEVDNEIMLHLEKLAGNWGLLFQLQDDYLDRNEVGTAKNILQFVDEDDLVERQKELLAAVQNGLKTISRLLGRESRALEAVGFLLRTLEGRKQ